MQKLLLVYDLFSEIALQTKSGKYFQIWFFPRFGGNSEHAHASYPGLNRAEKRLRMLAVDSFWRIFDRLINERLAP